jgi:formamidase
MRNWMCCTAVLLAATGLTSQTQADTTDVTWQNQVVVAKQGAHCADDRNCFNRYHPQIPSVARANPGDLIVFETRDALDSDLTLDSVADDVTAVDLNLVHPMTGPVHIEGAEQGDVLAVTLVDIAPDQYGYTVIVPGFGFLRDLYTEPYLVNWKLDRQAATSDEMPGVRIPMAPFMGSVGVLPGDTEVKVWLDRERQLAEAGGVALPPQPIGALPAAVCGPNGSHPDQCLRTIPPRENGGNMDVQQMQVGTTLLLPCFIDGCGLFVGDVHYAQGDGEVSGTAIEMGAVVTVRTEVLQGRGSEITSPHFEGGEQLKAIAPERFYATVGFPLKAKGEVPAFLTYLDGEKIGALENLSEDLTLAARAALIDMIDYLQREHGLTREQAYILCSVAVDLVVGQVVDVPNYTVSAILDLEVFESD